MATVKAFRCSRTGMCFPPDYIEEWGKKYGIGLGPVPVSEALVNDYFRPVVSDPKESGEKSAMHPLSVCKAQIDFVDVEQAEYDANIPILAIDDQNLIRRGQLMRDKQLVKSGEMKRQFPGQVAEAQARIDANKY